MSRKKIPAGVSRKAASSAEFSRDFWLPVRTPTGALVTVFGVDYANEKPAWDYALRVAVAISPVRDHDFRVVDEGECHGSLMNFVTAIGQKVGIEGPPPFVAALEGSRATGFYYSIIIYLPIEPDHDDVFEAIWTAWPNFGAVPDVVHETAGPDEVRHLLGRTQYYCPYECE
jgi:hypothetical protein